LVAHEYLVSSLKRAYQVCKKTERLNITVDFLERVRHQANTLAGSGKHLTIFAIDLTNKLWGGFLPLRSTAGGIR